MCCYDGIYLSAEEARVVAELASVEADYFREIGLELPDQVVVYGNWENQVSGPKTAVVPWPGSKLVGDFPPHFNDTTCVFHLPDGRCGLQALGEARGRHSWYYKPTGCWLHPLTTNDYDGPAIRLFDETTDPARLPHYPGFIALTRCGRTVEQGEPAHELLREELDFLGGIIHRDLYAEASGRRLSLKLVGEGGTIPSA